MGLAGGILVFAYGGNNPIHHGDPLGLVRWDEVELSVFEDGHPKMLQPWPEDLPWIGAVEVLAPTEDGAQKIRAWKTIEELQVDEAAIQFYESFITVVQEVDSTGYGIARYKEQYTYSCHGFTFDGINPLYDGPFSPLGKDVPIILTHDGWKDICCSKAQKGDIAVFWKDSEVMHSGKIVLVVTEQGKFIEADSLLQSKPGSGRLSTDSFYDNIAEKPNGYEYGNYKCFSKNPPPDALFCCQTKECAGDNEIPPLCEGKP